MAIDEDGIREIANTKPVLIHDDIGVLGIFMDDSLLLREAYEERRRNVGGDLDREGGGEEGVRVEIAPTPINLVGISGFNCNLYDAGGLRFGGIKVDALIREEEEISLSRRCRSTMSGEQEDVEDDAGSKTAMPPGGHIWI